MDLKKTNLEEFIDNYESYDFVQGVEYSDEYRVLLTAGGGETYEAVVSFDKRDRTYYVDLENLTRHEEGSQVEVESALFEATRYSGWQPVEG